MVVVAQKAVSKVEGRVVALADVEASERAREIAGDEVDPRRIEVILGEAAELVRVRDSLVIARTHHGFVCGSAGVDASNAPERDTLVLLPVDPDASAARLRAELRERTGADVGVIVTDSFGRPWRAATTDVAIGAAGVEVVHDLIGEHDPAGYELHATRICPPTRSPAPPSSSSASSTASPSQSSAASTSAATAPPRRSSSRGPRPLPVESAPVADPIDDANALLADKGYAERDLASIPARAGRRCSRGTRSSAR